jgi:hypothetical protein
VTEPDESTEPAAVSEVVAEQQPDKKSHHIWAGLLVLWAVVLIVLFVLVRDHVLVRSSSTSSGKNVPSIVVTPTTHPGNLLYHLTGQGSATTDQFHTTGTWTVQVKAQCPTAGFSFKVLDAAGLPQSGLNPLVLAPGNSATTKVTYSPPPGTYALGITGPGCTWTITVNG